MIGSMLNRSDATMLILSTLPATSSALAPSEPGASIEGVPVKASVVPTPAWSVRVTVKDPAASGIASTLDSVKRSTRVVPEAPPRGTLPTAVTPTSPNTSWGVGVGVGAGVGPRRRWSDGPWASRRCWARRRRLEHGERDDRRQGKGPDEHGGDDRPEGPLAHRLTSGPPGRPRRRARSARRACRHGTAGAAIPNTWISETEHMPSPSALEPERIRA